MKKLGQSAIGTGSGTQIYLVPTGMRTEVLDICLANTTGSPLTAGIYLVPTGATAGTTNALFPTVTIQPYSLVQWTGKQILNAGDFIQGIGSGSGITVNVSGDEGRAGT